MRQIYGALDLLGDLGGVYEIITLVLAIQMLPISRHSFILKATKKHYRGRTKAPALFQLGGKPRSLPGAASRPEGRGVGQEGPGGRGAHSCTRGRWNGPPPVNVSRVRRQYEGRQGVVQLRQCA